MVPELGMFSDYGHIIIPICLILYACLYTYLCHEYDPIDYDE
jgi:hypothetical protein